MFSTFVLYSTLATVALSFCLAPFGCILLWRRQAFFGDSLSHSAVLGVGLALINSVSPWWGIVIVGLVLAALLAYGEDLFKLPADSWLGLLSYTCLALGYIVIRYLNHKGMASASVEHFLFADLLLLTGKDVVYLSLMAFVVVISLSLSWPYLIATMIDKEHAHLQGCSARHIQFFIMAILAFVVATALPLIGAFLVPGLLILPAAIAHQFSYSPTNMLKKSILSSFVMLILGLAFSYEFDCPVGASSMVVGFMLFICAKVAFKSFSLKNKEEPQPIIKTLK